MVCGLSESTDRERGQDGGSYGVLELQRSSGAVDIEVSESDTRPGMTQPLALPRRYNEPEPCSQIELFAVGVENLRL